jgi:acetylornithine deacetylase/succinyl-diaminopimelate desuccinylase-like protein
MKEEKWDEIISKVDRFKVVNTVRNAIKIGGDLTNEAEKADWVVREMERRGMEVIETIIDPAIRRRSVVGILRGDGTGKSLILSAHLDVHTAPPELKNIEREAIVKDGKIYGVGAGDSMTGMGAIFGAIDAVKRGNVQLKGDVVMLCAVDELCYKEGIRTIMENGLKADMAIIEVATNFDIATCHTGKVELEVRTKGEAPFEVTAYGDRAVKKSTNAIVSMNKIISSLLQMVEKEPYFHKTHPLLPGEGAGFTIASIIGGSHGYGEPTMKIGIKSDEHASAKRAATWCKMRVSARFWPGETAQEFIDLVNKWIDKTKAQDPSVEAEVEVYMNEPLHIPLELSPDEEIVKALRKATKHVLGRESKIAGQAWSTEAPYYQQLGIPAVGFGPGPLSQGNPDEHVSIEDLMNCSKIFTAAILEVCT